MSGFRVSRCCCRGVKDSRVRGFEWNAVDYARMLYISYGSVCELETQILLAGDLGYIEKSVQQRKILQKSKEC